MHLKYQVRKKKITRRSLWQSGFWTWQGEGVGGRQTRRFRNVERLSMVSFTEPVSSVLFINDTVPTLGGAGGVRHSWRRLREGKQAGGKVSTLIASKLQPSQRRVFLELPSCHFKISTHLTQIGWVIIIFVKLSGLFWTKNTSNQIYLNIILH